MEGILCQLMCEREKNFQNRLSNEKTRPIPVEWIPVMIPNVLTADFDIKPYDDQCTRDSIDGFFYKLKILSSGLIFQMLQSIFFLTSFEMELWNMHFSVNCTFSRVHFLDLFDSFILRRGSHRPRINQSQKFQQILGYRWRISSAKANLPKEKEEKNNSKRVQ